MKWNYRVIGILFALSLWGCAPDAPRYEAVGVVGYRKSVTDQRFEAAFLRSELFLRVVFDEMPSSDLHDFEDSLGEKNHTKNELFRRFVQQSYARQGAKDGEIEVCFLAGDPGVATTMANRILETYLDGRGDQAHLIRRAKKPDHPKK